jgi:hypothetical protein
MAWTQRTLALPLHFAAAATTTTTTMTTTTTTVTTTAVAAAATDTNYNESVHEYVCLLVVLMTTLSLLHKNMQVLFSLP